MTYLRQVRVQVSSSAGAVPLFRSTIIKLNSLSLDEKQLITGTLAG